MNAKKLLLRLFELVAPARRLQVFNGDSLPPRLPFRALVLARDDGEDWCIGMRCPCGCGRKIELLLIEEAAPRWNLGLDEKARPSLTPSIWLRDGCESHFWLRYGRVHWCP